MSVSVGKLWNNAKFSSLTNNAKLLYLYLITTPDINYVGVVFQRPEHISSVLNITLDELRDASNELINVNLIFVKKYEGNIYFIIPSHFSTVGKSDIIVEKIKSNLKSLPQQLQEFLKSIGIEASKKRQKFNKPSPEEVEKYSISIGHFIDGETFCNFYENNPLSDDRFWYDGRGKIVSDWRAKLRIVWAKDSNKINLPKNAPKGFEHFYIKKDDEPFFPDYWKNGLPYSKDFLINKQLQQEYEKRKTNS